MKLGYKYRKALLLAMVLVLSLLVAGCDQQKESKDSSSGSGQAQVETSAETKQAANDLITEVNVYFPDENATGLFPERKSVKATDKSKYKAAMEALMAGPKDKRLTSVMPGKTQLLWVKMDKDTVKVNFDENICRSFRGGSTGEEMLVGSIVNTLTEFPEVKQVQILVEGHEVDSIGGHLDTSKPLKRMKELLRK